MAFPLQRWRRWHRKVNLKQRRHALASALAATQVTSLVLARGHKVMGVPCLPLVLDNSVVDISKTREAVELLKRFGLWADVERVQRSHRVRTGRSKVRGGRYSQRKGPLVVVNCDSSSGLVRALRNIPGVDTVHVQRLNIRLLAPGGQMGRLTAYTQSAMQELSNQFGSFNGSAKCRRGYTLKREVLTNSDVSSIINSDVIQSVVRAKRSNKVMHFRQKHNPLKNKTLMDKLNPYQATLRTMKYKKITKNANTQKQSRERALNFLKKIEERTEEKQQEQLKDYRETMAITRIN